MANLKPLGDRIVVLPAENEKVTASGILIPDTAKEKPQEGKVVAVGPGKLLESGERVAPEIEEGARILYSKYSGTEFKLDGTEYLILSERDVLAVID
ncbi:MAG TPA: co-chaperone GroES [Chloroflexia bacterium]|nr:co-chaperone GroES [Chloroflexia bacterium]